MLTLTFSHSKLPEGWVRLDRERVKMIVWRLNYECARFREWERRNAVFHVRVRPPGAVVFPDAFRVWME